MEEIIPELTPYYIGPADSSSSDTDCDFFDAVSRTPPPEYTPPSPPLVEEGIAEGECVFRCYVCGLNIGDGGVDFCLNCGMMKEKSTNANYKECTNCNSYYLTECDVFFCNRCGNSLSPMSSEIYCNCGYANSLDAEDCVSCGFPLVFYKYNELFKGHTHIPYDNTRYCYKCGIYLVPDGSAPPDILSPADERCVICLDNRREAAFLPCGHRCICSICGDDYDDTICPLCRYPYKDISKIYL